ncbi:glycosyltransferase family 4 protein [Candidatus Nomurabacteria bacterium]|uniref:Glycosyltransferase family 4 protein n=1 Tax=candidate division WWE3 bacterium TaxID=2053526 RepID=A0A955E1G8_UNCKA|nr:glycosyltransferase family 4 protein [candidate division WWE3 bacterium]MCB9823889.1 glycosyltransferase family 4 protein [Candidatus Nomurabacteria bacterium]MCB9827131.1 glycosyltransferase family 4 protein [Candidatus Nomurabacteria bacterium]MCB9827828.1 glycosyltransferase family 4 protein [Candidatus Nomurabacteria bacterium]
MNIVICTANLENTSGYNLVPRYTAIELAKMGQNVMVMCIKKPNKLISGEEKITFYEIGRENLIKIPFATKKLDDFQPNIIYSHGVALTDLLGTRYAVKKDVILFTAVHTNFSKFVANLIPIKNFDSAKLNTIVEKLALKQLLKSTVVFALTEEMKSYLKSLGLNNVELLSNGVDLEAFEPTHFDISKVKKVKLLSVGQISQRKNQLFLVETAKYLKPNIILQIAGGETWDKLYYIKFTDYLKQYKPKNVEYLGLVEHNEIPNLYKKAHVYVASSLLEAQSLAQIEAIACGLPTVRLFGENTKGITENNVTAIHIPENSTPKDFAEAINLLVTDAKTYNKLRENCLIERSRYSWKATANGVLETMKKYIVC